MQHAPASSRRLFQAALSLFVITVAIGILNGTDAMEFDRNTLLTHVHAGTLGWITLAVIGVTLWMFRRPDDPADVGRTLAMTSIGAIALYVAAFWIGNATLRPIGGSLAFVPIGWTLWWAASRSVGARVDVPRYAMLLALVSLTIGAVLGILLGLATTGRASWVPSSLAEAHPPTMVIGYLILAGMATIEWRLRTTSVGMPASSRAGLVQVWLMFVAGVALVLGIVLDVLPLLMLSTPLELVGIGIFLWRLRTPLRGVAWSEPGAGRYYATSAGFLTINVLLIVYIVATYADDIDALPFSLLLTLDHVMFIGVMTNVLAGTVREAAGGRALRAGDERAVIWGINGGLVLFAVGLASETAWLKRAGTPVMGLALLAMIAVYVSALAHQDVPEPATPV